MGERPSIKKRLLVVLGVIAAVAVVVLMGGALYLYAALGQINRFEEQETLTPEQIQAILAETNSIAETLPTEIPETKDPEEPETIPTEVPTEPTTEPVTEPATEPVTETVPEEKATVVNILLIGQDRRINEPRQRSDAMILCTVNMEKKTVVLTSFLRDTYVDLPGTYGMNKLNACYVIGGFEMLDKCLEQNFGVHVDHNIEVDFTGFKQVIDAIGGIDIDMTAGEAEIVEGDQEPGMNHLDGGQALMYARIRKLDDDFGRTDRQRKVLLAVYDRLKQLSILKVLMLADEVFPMITTDMTNEEILGYVAELFPILDELEIVTQSVPDKESFEYENVDGMSVVIPYMNKIRKQLAETIGS